MRCPLLWLRPVLTFPWTIFLLAIPTPEQESASPSNLPDSATSVGGEDEDGGTKATPGEEPPPIRPPPGERGLSGSGGSTLVPQGRPAVIPLARWHRRRIFWVREGRSPRPGPMTLLAPGGRGGGQPHWLPVGWYLETSLKSMGREW